MKATFRSTGMHQFKLLSTIIRVLSIAVFAIFMFSCRGSIKKKPPIHPNMNMDQQNRFEAQEKNEFFADNRAMRQPVEGTVARNNLKLDSAYYAGINEDGSYISSNPHEITKAFVNRGRDQYEIYCEPCHGGVGDGRGIIMVGAYGYVPAPSYHTDRLRNAPDGQLYDAIYSGVRSMPSYATQIEVDDRWAIVSYIRALQQSQYVTEEEMDSYDVNLAELNEEYQKEQEKLAAQEEAQSQGSAEANISAERGEQVYTANACQTCHSRDGSRMVGPTHQGIYEAERKLASGETIVADEEYLYESIVKPNAKVVEGYPGAMPSYSYLSEAELQSLVEYLKTL